MKALAEGLDGRVKPKWLDVNTADVTARVVAMPARDDIDFEIDEQLIVELYSKSSTSHAKPPVAPSEHG